MYSKSRLEAAATLFQLCAPLPDVSTGTGELENASAGRLSPSPRTRADAAPAPSTPTEDSDSISLSSDSSDEEDGPEASARRTDGSPAVSIEDQPGNKFVVEDMADLHSQKLRDLVSSAASLVTPPAIHIEAEMPARKRLRPELTDEDWQM